VIARHHPAQRVRQRQVDLGTRRRAQAALRGEAEGLRKDAGNRHRLAVDQDRLANERRVCAEALLPKAPTQHRDARRPLLIFARDEAAADVRTRAKNLKEVGRDAARLELLRLAAIARAERDASGADGRESFEGLHFLAQLDDLRASHPRFRDADHVEAVPDHHQTRGIAVGKRLEEDPVRDAEDRRVRGDAEREGQDHDRGIPPAAGKGAEAVFHIAAQILQPRSAARLLFVSLHSAERGERLAARLLSGKTHALELRGFHVHVKAHLGVHLIITVLHTASALGSGPSRLS
jgi:hypothetical protein